MFVLLLEGLSPRTRQEGRRPRRCQDNILVVSLAPLKICAQDDNPAIRRQDNIYFALNTQLSKHPQTNKTTESDLT